ncbi:Rhodanese-like domain-containing protein [Massariosphaeria phaeospora]|uniref:Rhodanese-like domain-containing protein n=1 Tax=Massariosphaeria phaeospora TaxID=100035 RepID=A0A7C8I4L9_9PLEO|nr:Rhodanese-like domain-containing protein [Massariosphaeria phaeospora]
MATRIASELLALRTRFLNLQTRFLSLRNSSLLQPIKTVQPITLRINSASLQRQIRVLGVRSRILEQRRWHSGMTDGQRKSVYSFEDVLKIIENPSDSTLIIDVREPFEFAENAIPLSLNIPITSQPDALLLPPEEFQDRFGFMKPPTTHEVVFYCKAGVRSSAAAQLARQAGYEKVREYRGSWIDWVRNGGPGTKSPSGPGGKGEINKSEVKEVKDEGGSRV